MFLQLTEVLKSPLQKEYLERPLWINLSLVYFMNYLNDHTELIMFKGEKSMIVKKVKETPQEIFESLKNKETDIDG